MEEWKIGGLDDWMIGRVGDWGIGGLDDGNNDSFSTPWLRVTCHALLEYDWKNG